MFHVETCVPTEDRWHVEYRDLASSASSEQRARFSRELLAVPRICKSFQRKQTLHTSLSLLPIKIIQTYTAVSSSSFSLNIDV